MTEAVWLGGEPPVPLVKVTVGVAGEIVNDITGCDRLPPVTPLLVEALSVQPEPAALRVRLLNVATPEEFVLTVLCLPKSHNHFNSAQLVQHLRQSLKRSCR